MENTVNLVELFSGIGSQAKALKNLGLHVNIQGTCEWDIHPICAYDVMVSIARIVNMNCCLRLHSKKR